MNRRITLPCLGAALLSASAANARTADYARGDDAFAADARALEVADFPAMPERGDVDVEVENIESLDHRLKILAISCRAWRVDNPLSQIVSRALTAWDRDGSLAPPLQRPLLRIRFESALSTMRCVEVAEMTTRCLTRTAISGEATVHQGGDAARRVPIAVEVEHQQSVGVCGGIARGTALSGRSAAIALVESLRGLLTN